MPRYVRSQWRIRLNVLATSISGCDPQRSFRVDPQPWHDRRSQNGGLPMPDAAFDVDAWLTRIGYAGSRAPTLETLRALINAHSSTIAYESIDVLLHRPPKLDLDLLRLPGRLAGHCRSPLFAGASPAAPFGDIRKHEHVKAGKQQQEEREQWRVDHPGGRLPQ